MREAWLRLFDAVKTEEFQKIQDNLAASTDLAVITVDYKGRPLTTHSRCNAFCDSIRQIPEYEKQCEKCDSHGGLEAARLKAPFIYLCHANIVDFAVPIIVNDMYLGAIMAGQIRLESSERMTSIERIASMTDLEVMFKAHPHLKVAYQSMPKMSYSKIEAAANVIQTICRYIVQNPGEKILEDLSVNADKTSLNDQKNTSLLTSAVDYMEKNFHEKITLKQLSQISNISESYFSRLFSKVYGVSITEYLEEIRIRHAKKLLVSPELTINTVSQMCGYDDTSYFIKRFKNATGITPNEYRKTIGL